MKSERGDCNMCATSCMSNGNCALVVRDIAVTELKVKRLRARVFGANRVA